MKQYIAAAILMAVSTAVAGAIDYGNSYGHGLIREKNRHRTRRAELEQRQIDVDADLKVALLKCRNDDKCREQAVKMHTAATNDIRTASIREDATHSKNIVELQRYWGTKDPYDTRQCTMPGGGPASCKEPCSGDRCSP